MGNKYFYFAARLSISVFAIVGLGLATLERSAAQYQFVKIVESDDLLDFIAPRSVPVGLSVNNHGTVAFYARTDETTHLGGLFKGNGGPITPIAEFAGGFGRLPMINDSGLVAFQGEVDGLGEGVFVGDGGPLTPIALRSGEFDSLHPRVGFNNSGIVAFQGTLDAGGDGIFTGSGGPTMLISSIGHSPNMNDNGYVAFMGEQYGYGGDIIVTDGIGNTPIADSTGPLNLLVFPEVSNSNEVVFRANLDAGGMGIFKGDGSGPLMNVADSNGPFETFKSPSMSGNGKVAFVGYLDTFGGNGIYTGADPMADNVIATGGSLFGSTVSVIAGGDSGGFVHTSPIDINDRGDIAFYYILSDGRAGVALARLVPEPASLVLVGLAMVGLASVRARRRKSLSADERG